MLVLVSYYSNNDQIAEMPRMQRYAGCGREYIPARPSGPITLGFIQLSFMFGHPLCQGEKYARRWSSTGGTLPKLAIIRSARDHSPRALWSAAVRVSAVDVSRGTDCTTSRCAESATTRPVQWAIVSKFVS